MPTIRKALVKRTSTTKVVRIVKVPLEQQVREILVLLKRLGSKRVREEMGPKFGIHTENAYGVRMADIQKLGKKLERDHALAAALWATGVYEARLLAAYVEEPARVTGAQMDRWAKEFDNWAVCDTVCFHLFDRVDRELAFGRIEKWAGRNEEFVKRAAFALLASIALHDKSPETTDEHFARCLPLCERGANDERNFVKKGVSWGLRAVGQKRKGLRGEVVALAERLAASENAAARWVGRDVLRELRRKGG